MLAKPDDARPCTPQSCDWHCRACRIHGRPFYSHGDLQYLEHVTAVLTSRGLGLAVRLLPLLGWGPYERSRW